TAEDAGTALELAAGTPRPDLILLDVEMPGATGFDVCRVLKAEGNTADIPVIFLTSKAEGDAQLEGLEIGAVDYVLKPANAGVLKAAPLHDIGKLGVPAEILRRRDRLTVPDWEQMKRHPKLGADIIGEHDDPLLQLARQLALTHHEHWDGLGYPAGLKGNAIP